MCFEIAFYTFYNITQNNRFGNKKCPANAGHLIFIFGVKSRTFDGYFIARQMPSFSKGQFLVFSFFLNVLLFPSSLPVPFSSSLYPFLSHFFRVMAECSGSMRTNWKLRVLPSLFLSFSSFTVASALANLNALTH